MALILGLLPGALLGLFAIYYGFHLLSPLSKVPAAHWSAKFSALWITWIRYTGRELETLVDAHSKYGPIVQVGPRDVSVSCYKDGVRKIYDSGFPKPPAWYAMFDYFGHQNSFTTIGRFQHGLRRRRFAALYAKSGLINSDHFLELTNQIMYERLIPRLRRTAEAGDRVTALNLSYSLCADYISSFVFGYSSGSKYLLNPESAIKTWREQYENLTCHERFFVQETPRLYRFLKSLSIELLPQKYRLSKLWLEQWVMGMASEADKAMDHSKESFLSPADEPVVYRAVKEAIRQDSPELNDEEQRLQIASEMFDHVSASHEVLGLVVGYSLWYLGQNPLAQDRIKAELDASGIDMKAPAIASQEPNGKNRIEVLDSLPYLRAVVKECLRMRPTSTLLPRMTPPGKTVSIAGMRIPGETRINSFQWFIHRDPRKWNRPDEWDPTRWLLQPSNNANVLSAEENILWPFASGPRICIASHWSYFAMQNILATLCSSFRFTAISRADNCWPGSIADEVVIAISLRD